jgi:hypothetical protein
MIRRFVAAGLVTAAVIVVVAGAERATFVLANGQRVSGELTYKGGTVYTLDGKDYPSDEVAVIEFAGGEPPVSELRQLPSSVTQEHERDMFVMRDGSIVKGKLYHIAADGSSVSFDPLGTTGVGDRRTVPASQIARIYINAPKARSVYASRLNESTSQSAVATTGVESAGGQTVTVQANQPWTDTGINVRRGMPLIFTTSGEIQVGPGRSTGAEGTDPSGADTSRYPIRGMGLGGLIGRVGNSAPFRIGSSSEPIRMPATGRLFLGINDDHHPDNSGSFNVVVKRAQ